MFELIGFLFLGFGVALLSSFLGFGGGTLIVPLLPLITKLDIKTTIATSLAVITLNAANNTYNFHKKGLVKWRLVFKISAGSVLLGVISSRLTNSFDENLLRWIVIAVFCMVALVTFLGPKRAPQFLRKNTTFNHVIAGISAGIVAGFGGIGGATIIIPLFIIGHWVKSEEVAPTGNAINMLTAFVSVSTLILSSQTIEWRAIIIILLASTSLSFFARNKQHLLSENLRRYSILIFLISVISLQILRALSII